MYLESIAIPICNSYHFKLQLNEKIFALQFYVAMVVIAR